MKKRCFICSRAGIPQKVAKQLIVTGFLDEVIARLDDEKIGDHLRGLIEEKFRTARS